MSWRWSSEFCCPRLKRGGSYCSFGCTDDHPLCHFYARGECRYPHQAWCNKGWHSKKEEDATRSVLHERPRTPEPESMYRKRGRYDTQIATTNNGAEADLQIALARLDLLEMPDMDTLEHTYKQKMLQMPQSLGGEDVNNKGSEVTWAFSHIVNIIQHP